MNHVTFTTLSFCACFAITTAAVADTLNVPAEFNTIQEAVEQSIDGDTILVAAGTYYGSVDPQGRAITVIGTGAEGTVILDGQDENGLIKCLNGEGEDTVFVNLVLQNGGGFTGEDGINRGGAIWLDGSSPSFENCTVRDNFSSNGGGVYSCLGEPRFRDCLFSNNYSCHGGGFYLAGACGAYAQAAFENCTFELNHAVCGGGGLKVSNQECRIVNCTFQGNHADSWPGITKTGGAILGSSGGRLSISDSIFDGNHVHGVGAAIAVRNSGTELVLDGSIFQENWSDTDAFTVEISDGATASVQSTSFCNNQAGGIGGEWTDLGGTYVDVGCDGGCPADVDGNGEVGAGDVLAIIDAWGPCDDSPADINGDNIVDTADILLLLSFWDEC
jgi:predicted outer membrane repeat protein